MNMIKRKFSSLARIKADEAWKQETRNRLIAEIRFFSFNHTHSKHISVVTPVSSVVKTLLNPFAWMQSGVALMLIIIIALGGSVASVGATFGSLPGDVLYPVKRTIEHVQIAFSPSDEGRAKIHLDLVSRRVEEFYALAERIEQPEENSPASEKAERALEEVEKQMKTTQMAVLKIKDSALDQKKKDTIAFALSEKTAHIEGVIDRAVNALSKKGESSLGEKAIQVQKDVHASELSKVETVASLVQDEALLSTVLEPKKEALAIKAEETIAEIEQVLLSDASMKQLQAEKQALDALKLGTTVNAAPVRKTFGLPEKPLDETAKDSAGVILKKQETAHALVKKLTALRETMKTEKNIEQLVQTGKSIEQGVSEAKALVHDLTGFAKALGEDIKLKEDKKTADSNISDIGVVKGITDPSPKEEKQIPVVLDKGKTAQESPKIDEQKPEDKPKEQEPSSQSKDENDKPQEPIPPAI